MGEYDDLIQDADDRRDEGTAHALRRLGQLEAVLLARPQDILMIVRGPAGGPWEARLGTLPPAKGATRLQALLALGRIVADPSHADELEVRTP